MGELNVLLTQRHSVVSSQIFKPSNAKMPSLPDVVVVVADVVVANVVGGFENLR
jgi:hypothetical protein